MQQPSFLSIAHTKKLRCERFLDQMAKVIPWDRFLSTIYTHYEHKQIGRKKTEALLLLKIYFLQQWYNLSDPGVEEAIYDRNSFQKFLHIDLLADTVPDETTILNFRHFLEKHNLQQTFFESIKTMLTDNGLFMERGTIVDATIIKASSSTKNKDKTRDSDMSSTQKNGQWHFGMKAHIGVDAEGGTVHSLTSSTAKVHDKTMFDQLCHGKEKLISGDKAYPDQDLKHEYRQKGIYWAILDRATRNHPLSSKQKKRNKKLSSLRAKVEYPFLVVKHLWHQVKVRYKGLMKNTCQMYMLFGLANLYIVRKKLLATI